MRENYAYYANRSLKTRVLNLLRGVFLLPPLERWLVKQAQGRDVNSLHGKLVPHEYMYAKGTWRSARRGGFDFKLDLSDAVDHYIYFGLAEPGFDRLLRLVKPESRVIDVGANIGMLSLPFSRAASQGRVVSFEPDPVNHARLTEHLDMNSVRNVKVMRMGLGNETRTHRLYKVVGTNSGMNRIVQEKEADDRFPYAEIHVARLDDLWPQLDLDRVDVIKIDVEGFEFEVLKGAEATLRTHQPALFIELDDDNLRENGSSAEALTGWLQERGYAITEALSGDTLTAGRLPHCHMDILAVRA